jgi:hypothetical protein
VIRPQSFLVVDATARRHAAAIERQRLEGRWRQVVTLSADTTPSGLLAGLFADGTA